MEPGAARAICTTMCEIDVRHVLQAMHVPVRIPDDTGLSMKKNRLEAFSDGVIAIIITIMV